MSKKSSQIVSETVNFFWRDVAKTHFASPDSVENLGIELDSSRTATIPVSSLPENLSKVYESLYSAFGVSLDIAGIVKYDELDRLVYFTVPTVVLDAGTPVLMLGSIKDRVLLPLEFTGDSYSCMGKRCDLLTAEKDGLPPTLKIKGVSGYNHFFPVKVLTGISNDSMESLYDSGKFHEFLKGASAKFAKATTLCAKLIEDGLWPKTGIAFVLENCKITVGNGPTGPFESANCSLTYCSHPDLPYLSSDKSPEVISPTDIAKISFTSSTAVFAQVKAGATKLYVHFISPAMNSNGKPNSVWTPSMACRQDLAKVSPVLNTLLSQQVTGDPKALRSAQVDALAIEAEVVPF
jgi:hypothetical protein